MLNWAYSLFGIDTTNLVMTYCSVTPSPVHLCILFISFTQFPSNPSKLELIVHWNIRRIHGKESFWWKSWIVSIWRYHERVFWHTWIYFFHNFFHLWTGAKQSNLNTKSAYYGIITFIQLISDQYLVLGTLLLIHPEFNDIHTFYIFVVKKAFM